MKAWHFLANDKRLGYKDGRLVQVGETYRYKGIEPIALCRCGMHGSERIIDALQYANGYIICKVELGGQIIKGDDKVVATERKVLAMIDGEKVLRKFACMCAMDVLPKNAPEIVVQYLKTQDESIRDAARYAARYAAWGAVRCATWDAAWCAARDAAWYAARDAARYAAWGAAWDAARDAARDAQNRRLTRMVNRAMREAK